MIGIEYVLQMSRYQDDDILCKCIIKLYFGRTDNLFPKEVIYIWEHFEGSPTGIITQTSFVYYPRAAKEEGKMILSVAT